MKATFLTITGLFGGLILNFFGGWTTGMTTLLLFMGIDYAMGLVVAGVFKNSNKTENGGLESRAGWKGICRKIATLLLVGVAYRLDIALGIDYIQNGVEAAFIVNEAISIIENAGLMGIPIPEVLKEHIEVLKKKER